jgi:maltose O-acetyltransferase
MGRKYRGKGIIIKSPENLKLGKRVAINDGTWINAKGGVSIGDDTIIGPGVLIHSSNHNYMDPDVLISEQGHTDAPVKIGRDVWICGGARILPGSTIPDGCVIGAGGVVTRGSNLKPYSVSVGVPVRIIKYREITKSEVNT